MKKKIVATLLTLSLCATMFVSKPMNVFAGGAEFSGNANIENKTEWVGDTAEINVTGKTEGDPKNHIVYNVKIKWGDMTFIYDYGGKWNPKTHQYDVGIKSGKTEAGWVKSCVTGGSDTDAEGDDVFNNSITVINNSNYPITANISFNPESNFNSGGDLDPVDGIFATDQDTLWNGYCAPNALRSGGETSMTLHLGTYDNRNKTYYSTLTNPPTSVKKTVFFTLYGTPTKKDVDSSSGKIYVNIAPYVEPAAPVGP